MDRMLHRLRGLLGLGTIGGALGALFGGGWFLFGGGLGAMGFEAMASVGGALGAAAGVGFGVLLTATSRRQRLEEVSLRRGALLGAVAGAIGPLILASLLAGSAPPIGIGLWFVGIGGSLGAGLGVGLLAVAKQSPASEVLPPSDEVGTIQSGQSNEVPGRNRGPRA